MLRAPTSLVSYTFSAKPNTMQIKHVLRTHDEIYCTYILPGL